ncbi:MULTISPECIES: hypothetical protein [unclassified Mesorhizobium]|uniref:hypothetical protein n=1 Tax=unclassified Mesorhizobium TaxID=325217 RepID=UPI001FE0B057|nr:MULTISPECIES: hypothetical protein [unclassified Mesorhizobium]
MLRSWSNSETPPGKFSITASSNRIRSRECSTSCAIRPIASARPAVPSLAGTLASNAPTAPRDAIAIGR